MPGMFDDILADLQGSPQPAATTAPQPPPVEESPLDSAARNLGNTVTFGQAPNIGGAVNYVMEGGAPGSFDQGYQQSVGATANSQAQNPDASTIGNLMGGGLLAAVPAFRGAQLLARAPRTLGSLLRYGLREALREKPQAAEQAPSAGFQGTGNPFSGPARNASIRGLSPEMQAKSDAYQAFLRRHSLNQ